MVFSVSFKQFEDTGKGEDKGQSDSPKSYLQETNYLKVMSLGKRKNLAKT